MSETQGMAGGGKRTRSQREAAGGGKGDALATGVAPSPAVSAPRTRDADGWLVSPPAGLEQAKIVRGNIHDVRDVVPNAKAKEALDWMRALFDAGATARHIERARLHVGYASPGIGVIPWLRESKNGSDHFEAEAGKRDAERARAREDAERPAHALRLMRTWLAQEEREADEAKEAWQKKRDVVERRRAEIEKWMDEHPHLRTPEASAA